jgi:hypothetical protein
LNFHQLRLFGDRYIHVFELWFPFRLFYRSLFGFYARPKQTNFCKNAFKRSNRNHDCESLTLIKKTQETRFLR